MTDPRMEGTYYISHDSDELYYPGMDLGNIPFIGYATLAHRE